MAAATVDVEGSEVGGGAEQPDVGGADGSVAGQGGGLDAAVQGGVHRDHDAEQDPDRV